MIKITIQPTGPASVKNDKICQVFASLPTVYFAALMMAKNHSSDATIPSDTIKNNSISISACWQHQSPLVYYLYG